ncbi:hypothetical protein KBZ10_13815 [Streptomyces sp. F63]|uniref:helix-turn-helix transcriptional regulator n=1 Tax=Streptomyces sp. F63 TaxID=2824887 RepID=UPI001B385D08|nr:helix-turn-helix transcriptional regulator [Streptomyces sp. F63]MBQ0985570.1 hypothetical protein [Streptomyces sp. F63]
MPLRDRTYEPDPVRAAVARVRDGGVVLLAVTGTPGAGRSTLLEAIAERAEQAGFAVRQVRGSRLEQGLPFALPLQLSPRTSYGPRGPALSHLVPAGPVALVVDDLQWADEASLAWLAWLLADPEPVPLLMAVAVCEGEPTVELPGVQDFLAAADHVVRAGPLDVAGARALTGAHGIVLADEQVREWIRATDGNPALMVSLLERLDISRVLAPARLLGLARGRPAPWKLRARVAAALTGHPEYVRRFAHCAALLGEAAGTPLLGRLAQLDPDEETTAAQTLLRLGWAADRRSPPVLWDCVREIAEDCLSPADRARFHRRAAELLHETGAPAGRAVPHLREIGPGEWTGAPTVLRETACEAWRRGDDALAVRSLRRALREFPADSPQRGDFLAALADAEQNTDTAAMLRHVGQALPLLGSVRERAAVVACVPLTLFFSTRGAAELLKGAGQEPAGKPAAAPAVSSGVTDPQDAATGLRLEARTRLFGLTDPAALAAAVERLRTMEPGTGTAAGRELVSVLLFAGGLGARLSAAEVAAGVRRTLESEPASAASSYAATTLLIACAAAAEAAEPALGWLDMALETARQRGDERLRTHLLGWRALTALRTGRLAEAWSDAWEACAAAPGPLGENDWLTVFGLTSVAVETGDPWLAERLRALLAEGDRAGMPLRSLLLRMLRAGVAPESELPALAADLRSLADRAETAGWRNWTLLPVDLWCASLLLRLGERRAALEVLARACERARAFGAPAALGRTLRVWGTAVHGRYALSLLAESVAVLRESANDVELGRSLTAYGNRLRAAGRPGSAGVLAEADRIAETVGEPLLRCWAGPVPSAPGGKPLGTFSAGGGPLSETERRVASLVALGHTNRGTAEVLGVTTRAVEKILTRLYRRLGVTGKAGLIPVVRGMAGRAAFTSGLLTEQL